MEASFSMASPAKDVLAWWHSTRGADRRGRKRPRDGCHHECCAGVAAQTTPVQTISWSIPITTSYREALASKGNKPVPFSVGVLQSSTVNKKDYDTSSIGDRPLTEPLIQLSDGYRLRSKNKSFNRET